MVTIKRSLFTALLILTCAVSASAYDFMADEIAYNINSDGKSVTVTYQQSSNPHYSSLKFSDDDGDSPISVLAKMAAKQGVKFAIKRYAKQQIEHRFKNYMSK
ncbi:MAG: hypothetical protein IJ626_00010 [Muribaculaceae bacterium]|nr:hypothetical protein [Muribaculaceae bacterium]